MVPWLLAYYFKTGSQTKYFSEKTVKKRMFPIGNLIFLGSQAQFWCFSEPTRCAEHRCIKVFSKNSIFEKSIFHRGDPYEKN